MMYGIAYSLLENIMEWAFGIKRFQGLFFGCAQLYGTKEIAINKLEHLWQGWSMDCSIEKVGVMRFGA